MKNLIIFIFFLIMNLAYTQSTGEFFSTALNDNIRKYRLEAELAYEDGDLEKGRALFDSLVYNHLIGTQFDNFRFRKFEDDSYFRTNRIDKPFVLITSASWCVVAEDQIAALNLLAEEYAEGVEIIILFWDRVDKIIDLSIQYSEKIPVIYFDETYNRDSKTLKTLKHSLGLPVCFYVDQNKKVVEINRGGVFLPYGTKEDLYSINYNIFKNSVDNLILSSSMATEDEGNGEGIKSNFSPIK